MDNQDGERISRLSQTFTDYYGRSPSLIVRAPGRVNLIGEHTDYNDGFVLPIAIGRSVLLAAAPRRDRRVHICAIDLNREAKFDLDDIRRHPTERWSNYQRGVAHLLQEAGHRLMGMDAVLTSSVPVGAGLSSSAAVEVAAAWAFTSLSGIEPNRVQMARLCQQAEHEFAGVPCGIMDQFIVALGRQHHALLLDCRSLAVQHVLLPASVRVVVADTGVRRELAGSAYAERRTQCEEATRRLGVPALRDVTVEMLAARAGTLPTEVHARARHIVSENERVLDAVATLRRGDVAAFGHLMNESHRSLRDDYEVSGPELDAMVAAAQSLRGCYGSRLTGAGFGGCTVSLVAEESVETFRRDLTARYKVVTGREATVNVCTATDGAGLII